MNKRNLLLSVTVFVLTFILFAGDQTNTLSIQSRGSITCEDGEVISVDPEHVFLQVGETFIFDINVEPDYEEWEISSDDESFVSVCPNEGSGDGSITLTAHQPGSCILTFTLKNHRNNERATIYIPVDIFSNK